MASTVAQIEVYPPHDHVHDSIIRLFRKSEPFVAQSSDQGAVDGDLVPLEPFGIVDWHRTISTMQKTQGSSCDKPGGVAGLVKWLRRIRRAAIATWNETHLSPQKP